MNCPACKEVELRISERQNVEIDYCPQCRGVWLDKGELDKLIERSLQQETPRMENSRAEAPQEYSAPAAIFDLLEYFARAIFAVVVMHTDS